MQFIQLIKSGIILMDRHGDIFGLRRGKYRFLWRNSLPQSNYSGDKIRNKLMDMHGAILG